MKKEEGAKPNWLFKELNKPDHGNRGTFGIYCFVRITQ